MRNHEEGKEGHMIQGWASLVGNHPNLDTQLQVLSPVVRNRISQITINRTNQILHKTYQTQTGRRTAQS